MAKVALIKVMAGYLIRHVVGDSKKQFHALTVPAKQATDQMEMTAERPMEMGLFMVGL